MKTSSNQRVAVMTVILSISLLQATGFTAPALAQTPTTRSIEDEARRAERERRQREERDERFRRLMNRYVDYVQETSSLFATLETKAQQFASRCEALPTNDDGKRLAATSTGFYAYLRLREHPVLSLEQIRSKRRSIDGILETVRAETQRDLVGFLPSEEVDREVSALHEEAKRWLGVITEHETSLESAVSKAPKDLELSTAKTMESLVKQDEANRIERWAIARSKGEQKAQTENARELEEKSRIAELERGTQEAEQLLRTARADRAAERAEFEARIKQQEISIQRQLVAIETRYQDEIAELKRKMARSTADRELEDTKSDIETDKVRKEAEKKRLVEKCKDPQVKALLAPFLAKGYWQPGDRLGRNVDLKPISYSKLSAFGALQPTADGIKKLLQVATKDIKYGIFDKDRPRWPYTSDMRKIKGEQLEEVKKAQALLIELGDTMVELDMLAK